MSVAPELFDEWHELYGGGMRCRAVRGLVLQGCPGTISIGAVQAVQV
jgi:hypothetical protein